ncbi:MAG: hypothetical protein ACXVZJ_10370 [Terriglobales bacterium]
MHLTTAPAAATKSPTPALIQPRKDRNWWIFLAVCLLLGATLRLVFPTDIEYKADERYSMSAVEQFRQSGAIPAVGMPSSTGVVNAGPSVWIFLLLGSMSGANNPAELARSVAVLNILALAILAAIALRVVPPEQREIWCWTAALFCVNVFAVLFARKIWPQCVEPFFTALLILAWFHRSRRAGAFCWGVLEALLGQFHMAGFFFAAALLLWTVAFDRRRERGPGNAVEIRGDRDVLGRGSNDPVAGTRFAQQRAPSMDPTARVAVLAGLVPHAPGTGVGLQPGMAIQRIY